MVNADSRQDYSATFDSGVARICAVLADRNYTKLASEISTVAVKIHRSSELNTYGAPWLSAICALAGLRSDGLIRAYRGHVLPRSRHLDSLEVRQWAGVASRLCVWESSAGEIATESWIHAAGNAIQKRRPIDFEIVARLMPSLPTHGELLFAAEELTEIADQHQEGAGFLLYYLLTARQTAKHCRKKILRIRKQVQRQVRKVEARFPALRGGTAFERDDDAKSIVDALSHDCRNDLWMAPFLDLLVSNSSPDLFISAPDTTPCTDGQTVRIPSRIFSVVRPGSSKAMLQSFLVHEAAHIEEDSFSCDAAVADEIYEITRDWYSSPPVHEASADSSPLTRIADMHPSPSLYMHLLNIYEDRRIEYHIRRKYPGVDRRQEQFECAWNWYSRRAKSASKLETAMSGIVRVLLFGEPVPIGFGADAEAAAHALKLEAGYRSRAGASASIFAAIFLFRYLWITHNRECRNQATMDRLMKDLLELLGAVGRHGSASGNSKTGSGAAGGPERAEGCSMTIVYRGIYL